MKTIVPDPDAVERLVVEKERGTRNRSAWPVAMHMEKGELKADRKPGQT